ncbi:MAG: phosphotransferase [Candidatus Latescibacteria bacterium]|nr:phosphotransferase [Candidatus Latescibacterota bacterium]
MRRCPLCDAALKSGPKKESLAEVLYRLNCPHCGTYRLDGRARELVAELGGKRAYLVNFVRGIGANGGLSTFRGELVTYLVGAYLCAEQACVQRGLMAAHIEHCGAGFDSRNPVFRVEDKGQVFSLRVHAPDAALDEIRAQLLWVKGLRDQAGLLVLQPLLNREGQPFELAGKGQPRPCVFYDWIEGETVKEAQVRGLSEQLIEKLGEFIAAMHRHSRAFTPPSWFVRPRYDREFIEQNLRLGQTQADDGDAAETVRAVMEIVDDLDAAPDTFGMVHSEPANANLLIQAGRIGAIDFQVCGWGYYSVNIVRALRGLFPKADELMDGSESRLFLKGYQRVQALPADLHRHAEVFLRAWPLARHIF